MTEILDVCPIGELPPGGRRMVSFGDLEIGVFNCAGAFYAIEDRCSHDDGPLVEGELDAAGVHGRVPAARSHFDLKTGRPRTLPAYEPVDTFPVIIDNDMIKLEVDRWPLPNRPSAATRPS